jgi:hypothetical protein
MNLLFLTALALAGVGDGARFAFISRVAHTILLWRQ